jgi:hypothetical protein
MAEILSAGVSKPKVFLGRWFRQDRVEFEQCLPPYGFGLARQKRAFRVGEPDSPSAPTFYRPSSFEFLGRPVGTAEVLREFDPRAANSHELHLALERGRVSACYRSAVQLVPSKAARVDQQRGISNLH